MSNNSYLIFPPLRRALDSSLLCSGLLEVAACQDGCSPLIGLLRTQVLSC